MHMSRPYDHEQCPSQGQQRNAKAIFLGKRWKWFLKRKESTTAADADADITPTIEQQIRQGTGNSEYH